MQRNWIGRSHGARVVFRLEGDDGVELPVFTTRPDTLFGATFFVMAPEHPLVLDMARGTEHEAAVADYVRHSAALSTVERASEKVKTGVFTGRYVINPVNGERIPVWVADYVLMEYGTGAIMAVPAHDDRDFDFAHQFGLEIRPVIRPASGAPDLSEGRIWPSRRVVLMNSGQFDGIAPADAKAAIIGWLGEEGRGEGTVAYRLRDWLLSRQRYWGCPDPDRLLRPVRHGARTRRPVAGGAPGYQRLCAARALAAGGSRGLGADAPARPVVAMARRETDTMDTFVDSSWYYMRYADPLNDRHRLIARSWTRGCRSTSTSVASSMPSCISFMPAFSPRRCTIWATSGSPSRSRTCSRRG